MSDQTSANAPETQKVTPTNPRTLSEVWALMANHPFGTMAVDIVRTPLDELLDANVKHNARVLRVNATKEQSDPNNHELIDAKWANAIASGSAPADIVEAEAEYQRLTEAIENIQMNILRPYGKSLIEAPLTPEEYESERKLANEEIKPLEDMRKQALSYADMADKILAQIGENAVVANGILSLIPETLTVRGMRGRKPGATTGEKGPYTQRVGGVDLNGVHIEVNGKSTLAAAAELLSKQFNASTFAPNTVIALDLHNALYDAAKVSEKAEMNKLLADRGSFEFDFHKSVLVRNANDDDTHEESHIVKVKVYRWVSPNAETEAATESAKPANAEPANDKPATPAANVDPVTKSPVNAPTNVPTENPAPSNVKVGPATQSLVEKRKAMQEAAKAAKEKK